MGWDQADQPKTGQTGTTLESPAVKPASNESVHSLFISDFLTDKPTTTSPDAQKKAPAEAAPKVTEAPTPTPAANPIFPETPYDAPSRERPTFSAPVPMMAAPRAEDYRNAAPPQQSTDNFYNRPQPSLGARPGGRDLTYSAMTRAMQMAQTGGQAAENPAIAGRRPDGPFRRLFQPPQDGRRQPPPGVPQEQNRQRLFGPNRGDAPAPKNEPMQKLEFKAATETGIVGEMTLPAKFKEVPKDPNLAPGEDPIRREFAAGNSRVSLYEGRQLTDEEQATLKQVMAKPGALTENSKGYDETLMLMGAGYFNFFNDPKVTVGKFQGKEALILSDSDPRTKQVGQTIFVRSDKDQYLYAINYQGSQADFANVQKGLNTIKWRPTPDAVKPPSPKKN